MYNFLWKVDYTGKKLRSGEVINNKCRIYIHNYYNDQKNVDEKLLNAVIAV